MVDLTDQLRRYADAADQRAAGLDPDLTSTTSTSTGHRDHRRLLAAAAAVVLLAASAGVVLVGRDDDQVRTTRRSPASATAPHPGTTERASVISAWHCRGSRRPT